VLARHQAAKWHTCECNGLDADAVSRAIEEALADPRPSLIRCKTIIGFGAPNKQGTAATHGAALGKSEVEAARAELGLEPVEFTVPENALTAWRAAGKRGAIDHALWNERLESSGRKVEFMARLNGKVSDAWLKPYLDRLLLDLKPVATRKASEMALEVINATIPATIGGSADLTGSNNTKTKGLEPLTADNYAGRYIYYGIREFGMAAAMNGMALHGGVIPYGGTFLVFTDYARPAIRLSALQKARVIYVMTHDSIGVGEDGPTHQPVEHVASLRAIPNLNVFRPADAVETAECWKLALDAKTTPSVMALSRQKVPAARTVVAGENLSARGAYQLIGAGHPAQISIFASGTEVSVALAARDLLEAEGIGARVVSTPCWELFDAQPADYQAAVIGETDVRVAVEAGVRQGWERFIGEGGAFVGMTGFGASAPAEVLYKHFAITAEAVAAAAKAKL
jgi:transketolase